MRLKRTYKRVSAIKVMMKHQYSEYLYKTNIAGSGKATSYVRALDLLSDMLRIRSFGFEDCIDIWNVISIGRIQDLKIVVGNEQRKGLDSEWLTTGIAPSYLTKGYCKAALSSYLMFLAETTQENALFNTFKHHKGDDRSLVKLLNTEPTFKDILLGGVKDHEGQDVIRKVKTRLNQNLFRRMLRDIYSDTCCITGLTIPQVNRASHIIPWSEDEAKRLDPSNGLYLSATYDAAFDQRLISLDDDYRIILSKDIKEYCPSESVKTYFLRVEGNQIALPKRYLPNKEYLEVHRKKGLF